MTRGRRHWRAGCGDKPHARFGGGPPEKGLLSRHLAGGLSCGGSVSVQGGKVMPEDALVNTGAVMWPHPDSAYFTVREMQTKLHRWAAGDPGRRFDDLFNLVYDPAFLVHAWERVSTNKVNIHVPAAGLAGIRIAELGYPGVEGTETAQLRCATPA